MLGRIIKLEEYGLTWEGDPRHVRILEERFGMNEHTKALANNLYELAGEDGEVKDEDLVGEEAKAYHMIAARLNFTAQDDVWLQFPAKELRRTMARSTKWGFQRAKKVVPSGDREAPRWSMNGKAKRRGNI